MILFDAGYLFFLILCLVLGPVSAWRACVLPKGLVTLGKPIASEIIHSLKCKNFDRNELLTAAAKDDPYLVVGALQPNDLKPLKVTPLQENMFLVKASMPMKSRRKRRSLFDNSRYYQLPNDEDTFVVSTFAINPALLNNRKHIQRYSVFARLTEGVLQEYYEKYAQDKKKSRDDNTERPVDPNSQIYTENLFNKIVDSVGRLRGDGDVSSRKKIQTKSFDEVLKEFETEVLDDDDAKALSAEAVALGAQNTGTLRDGR